MCRSPTVGTSELATKNDAPAGAGMIATELTLPLKKPTQAGAASAIPRQASRSRAFIVTPVSHYLFGNLPLLLIHSSIVANGVKFSVLA